MKTKLFILCAALCSAVLGAEFPLEGFQLRLYSCNGTVISHILRGSSRLVRHTGTLREQFWASDRFETSCRISKNLPGEFLMQWRLKVQNGIPEGAFIELSCHAEPGWRILPNGEEKQFILKTPERSWLCRIDGALIPQLVEQGGQSMLCWYWDYDARHINTVDFSIRLSVR